MSLMFLEINCTLNSLGVALTYLTCSRKQGSHVLLPARIQLLTTTPQMQVTLFIYSLRFSFCKLPLVQPLPLTF